MSLVKFQTALIEAFPALDPAVATFIQDYIDKEQAAYNEGKKNGKLNFGKYAQYTCRELSLTDAGKSYLSWVLAQSWCTPEKFGFIHDDCKSLGIKKNAVKKTPLI